MWGNGFKKHLFVKVPASKGGLPTVALREFRGILSDRGGAKMKIFTGQLRPSRAISSEIKSV